MKFVCIALMVVCGLQSVQSDDTTAFEPFDNSNYRLPQHRNIFIDFIESIAQQTIQLAKDAIKILQSRIDELIQGIYEKLFDLQQMGDDTLNAILNDLEKHNSGKSVSSCVENRMDEIKQIISNGREDISRCIQTAVAEAETVSQRLYPYVESIATLIQNITGVIDKCSSSSNPFSAAICITQHVTEISNGISAIIRDSQETIKLAIIETKALVSNTSDCVTATVEIIKARVQQIVNECNTNEK